MEMTMQEWRRKMLDKGYVEFFINEFSNLGLQPTFAMDLPSATMRIKFKSKEDMNLYKLLGSEHYIKNSILSYEE